MLTFFWSSATACLHVMVVELPVVLETPSAKHGSHTLTGSYSCSAGNGTRFREQSAQNIFPQLLIRTK